MMKVFISGGVFEMEDKITVDAEYNLLSYEPVNNLSYLTLNRVPECDDKFYNYLLFDPTEFPDNDITNIIESRKEHCFYVGKGKNRRFEGHFIKSFLINGSHRANKIRQILKKGQRPWVYFLNHGVDEVTADSEEIKLIKYFGRKDVGKGSLVNKTDGGEGRKNWIPTQKGLENMSKCRIGRFTGKDNPTARMVYQYTLEGKYIKEFDCVTDAVRSLNKPLSCVGNITQCMDKVNGIKTAYHFQWFPEYKGEKVPSAKHKGR